MKVRYAMLFEIHINGDAKKIRNSGHAFSSFDPEIISLRLISIRPGLLPAGTMLLKL
jgi:hypothetical protein